MRRLLACAFTLVSFASGALAQNAAPPPTATPGAGGGRLAGQVREACAADAQKYCPNLGPGRERRACMREHLAELTPACKEALSQARNAAGATRGRT